MQPTALGAHERIRFGILVRVAETALQAVHAVFGDGDMTMSRSSWCARSTGWQVTKCTRFQANPPLFATQRAARLPSSAIILAHTLIIFGNVFIRDFLRVGGRLRTLKVDHELWNERASWEKQALSARGVQARRKALRIRYVNGMELRKKRPRGVKKEARGVQVSPLNPLSVAPRARGTERTANRDSQL
jgi:hypothetical protein